MLFLTFAVGGDRFAIDAMRVVEVLPAVSWRRILGASHGIVGLLNYHQAVVPLLDLSMLILETPSTVRMHSRIVMVRVNLGTPDQRCVLLGLVAEGSVRALRFDSTEFAASEEVTATTPYLGAVATDAHGIIQRIEVDHLLDAVEHDQFLEQCVDVE